MTPLTDERVAAIASTIAGNAPLREYLAQFDIDVDALCATVRALRKEIAELTAEWCECGHPKTQHGFFSDHDECYECDQMSPDLCCEWRPAPRESDTHTALREQLAQKDSEIGSRLADIDTLQSQLAQVTAERDELRAKLRPLDNYNDGTI